jgi:hypothetical protein
MTIRTKVSHLFLCSKNSDSVNIDKICTKSEKCSKMKYSTKTPAVFRFSFRKNTILFTQKKIKRIKRIANAKNTEKGKDMRKIEQFL